MTTVYDVPTKALIDAVSLKLKTEQIIVPPEWSRFVRTGVHKEKNPVNKDWWFVRCASVLRKIYMNNGIGIEHLRNEYGGNRDRGSKPNKAKSGSGAIARNIVHQLEKAGYVSAVKGKGRIITAKGKSFLDNTAHEVKQGLIPIYPELKKY